MENLEFNYADITEFLSLSSYSFWAATLRTNAECCNRGFPSASNSSSAPRIHHPRPLQRTLSPRGGVAGDCEELLRPRRGRLSRAGSIRGSKPNTLHYDMANIGQRPHLHGNRLHNPDSRSFEHLRRYFLRSFGQRRRHRLSLSLGHWNRPAQHGRALMSIGLGGHHCAHQLPLLLGQGRNDQHTANAWNTRSSGSDGQHCKLSAMIAMIPILLKPSYLGIVFLKTLTLVSVFGLFHGLILLPAILTAFDDLFSRRKKVLPVLPPVLVLPIPARFGSMKEKHEEE
ncbi:hypothetical protein L596_027963 [Steinernema carpocapsae]|uniref:SSD domain-containing protein n=1 Tax=Steinernema carpocapsae TaxID=34508 RepID=A0A4U5LX16_STECR|nr:hypothetical protein L596_027963 [Steinernema carpocapsae]